MPYAELFSVDLPAEPDAELREKMRRYLYFKFPTRNAKAFEVGCAGIARVDDSTQLKLMAPVEDKPWRIVCQSWRPERLTQAPAAKKLGPKSKSTLALARLKPGTELTAGKAPVEALRRRVIDTLGV